MFEGEIAKIQGVKRAVFVNSGSSALEIGIRALSLPRGSEVIVPACTFPITLKKISREKVLKDLNLANVEWRPILAGNIAKQPAFIRHIIKRQPTPNADRLITDSFWVSVHPRNSVEMMKFVGETIKKSIINSD